MDCVYYHIEDSTWECSNCRDTWMLNDGSPKDNRMEYCPYCGAKIVGEKVETLEEVVDSMCDEDAGVKINIHSVKQTIKQWDEWFDQRRSHEEKMEES